jgi:hypothetical protein
MDAPGTDALMQGGTGPRRLVPPLLTLATAHVVIRLLFGYLVARQGVGHHGLLLALLLKGGRRSLPGKRGWNARGRSPGPRFKSPWTAEEGLAGIGS